jgi:hypothetical protein
MFNHSGLRGDTAVSLRAANLSSGNYVDPTMPQPFQSLPQTYQNPNSNQNHPLNSVSNQQIVSQQTVNQSLRNPQLSNQSSGLLKMDGIFA